MFSSNTLKQLSRFSRISSISKTMSSQHRNLTRTLVLKNKIDYTDSDEWLCYGNDSTKMGLTKKAIDELTDLVYIEFLHEKGDIIKENEDIVEIESVKATNSIAAPFDLVLLENNLDIEEDIDIINKSPEDVNTSWIIKVDKIP